MDLEVLGITMHQKDLSIAEKMNIKTNAVIGNQADEFSYIEENINGNLIRMMTTKTRGISKNRNIALGLSTADYVLFADDDLIFDDDYKEKIENEFKTHPEAEAIKFNIHDLSEIRKISMKRIQKFEKATMGNMSSSGSCGLVVKREVLIRNNITFHENFGSGTENYCGEDTIFLMEMIKKHVKIYRSPVDIAGINQENSSWFTGHNEKYFVTCGKVIATICPVLCYLIVIRSAYKFSKRDDCDMPFRKILKCYYKGIRERAK